MTRDLIGVWMDIVSELDRAKNKFPNWPNDPIHAVNVVGEEYGELIKEVLQMCYEPEKSSLEKVETEAIQLAAMSIRFLLSLEEYRYKKGEQHEQ